MKRYSSRSSSVALWIVIGIMRTMIAGIITLNILFQSMTDIKSLLLDLLNSLLSAVTVGLIISTFTKIITDNFARVKKNNQKLREFGVEMIGSGRSSKTDTLQLFGNVYKNEYPCEIKIMFISGNGFFKYFQDKLYTCLNNSDCTVKILLLSTNASNLPYIKRMEEMCPQETPYCEQVEAQSLPTLQSIIDRLDDDKKHRVKVRFYTDEYRYNFRIAKYCTDTDVQGRCWLNVQPFNRDAVDVSVALTGVWNNETSSDNNIFELLDNGFDQLWSKYEHTEYEFKY